VLGDALAAVSERRQVDDEAAEPDVEVLPEPALRDDCSKVPIGGRHDARADLDRALAAHPPDLAFLQGAQQLRLQRCRHLADLVEEERALTGNSCSTRCSTSAPTRD
jgi:hypothetical protein